MTFAKILGMIVIKQFSLSSLSKNLAFILLILLSFLNTGIIYTHYEGKTKFPNCPKCVMRISHREKTGESNPA